MTDAGSPAAVHDEPHMSRPRVVRTVIGASVLLYFLQLTVIAPGDVLATLAFSLQGLGDHWWSVATFPLVNPRFWPMMASLGVLGTVGTFLERRWGSAEFGRYLVACLFGAWVLTVALGQPGVVLAGSGAGALGTLVAFASVIGNTGLFRVGSLVLSGTWLAVFGTALILGTSLLTAEPADAAVQLIQGAGLVAGWAYLRAAASVNLSRLREGMAPMPDDAEDMPPRAVPRRPAREKQAADDDIVSKSNAAVAQEAAARAAARTAATPIFRDPALLNRVLDKISAHGIESLTADERRLLEDLSRRLRDQ
jgi:membrane associated rhomboid family serine protease